MRMLLTNTEDVAGHAEAFPGLELPTELAHAESEKRAAEANVAKRQERVQRASADCALLDEIENGRAEIYAEEEATKSAAYEADIEPDLSSLKLRLDELNARQVPPQAKAARAALPSLQQALSLAEDALAKAGERVERAERRYFADVQRTAIYELHDQLEALGVTLAKLAALDALIPSTGPFHIYRGKAYVERLSLAFVGQPVFKPSWAYRSGIDLPGYSAAMRSLNQELDAAKAG